ncbi:MAG: FAD-dependent oxidoreductase [Bacilli bacterium]
MGAHSILNAAPDIEKTGIADTYDVVVIGGGTAGTIAAIQAGRLGAKTLVIESGSQLGGTMTTGGVNFPGLFHAWGNQIIAGIGWELVSKTVLMHGDSFPDFKAENLRHWKYQVFNEYLYACLLRKRLWMPGLTSLFIPIEIFQNWGMHIMD